MTGFQQFGPGDKPGSWSAAALQRISSAAEAFAGMHVQAPLRMAIEGNHARLWIDLKAPIVSVRQYFEIVKEFPNYLQVSYVGAPDRLEYIAKPPLLRKEWLDLEPGAEFEYDFLNDEGNRVKVTGPNSAGETITETWVIRPEFKKGQLIRGINAVRGLDVLRLGATEDGENPEGFFDVLWDFDGPDAREWRLERTGGVAR